MAHVAAVPLRIDLLRHGPAAPAGAGGDAARPLSPDGARAIRRLGERLAGEGWTPERVLSSPYRRARETAELLLEASGVRAPVLWLEELEPERDPEDLAAVLGAHLGGARHALLVGHQPLAGRLAQRWCGSSLAPAPGELLQIEFEGLPERGPGRLIRHLTRS